MVNTCTIFIRNPVLRFFFLKSYARYLKKNKAGKCDVGDSEVKTNFFQI